MYDKIQSQSGIDRLHLSARGGGRGLLQFETTNTTVIINTAEHLNTDYQEDHFLNIVKNPN
jgi:hypothetical protein